MTHEILLYVLAIPCVRLGVRVRTIQRWRAGPIIAGPMIRERCPCRQNKRFHMAKVVTTQTAGQMLAWYLPTIYHCRGFVGLCCQQMS